MEVFNSNQTAIGISDLVKSYDKGKVCAVNGISLQVNKGELFGLIGPDGAGKSTVFRIMTTVLLPDSGLAFIDGRDVVKQYSEIRKMIGYMPGKFSLYQDLTVEENLRFFATLFQTTVEENYHLIRDIYIQLEPFKHRRAGKLSGGMKQKLALCCALIHSPEVLFLDEPTTGVDPVSRREFWEMLRRLKSSGITIMVSTPYMDEATLCDRIALMQNGHILKSDTPAKLIENYPVKLYGLWSSNNYRSSRILSGMPEIRNVYASGETVKFNLYKDINTRDFFENLKLKIPDCRISQVPPDIEDCFIELLKKNEN